MTAPISCDRCRRPLVPQRSRRVPADHRRHVAKGLCDSCYRGQRRTYLPGRHQRIGLSLDLDLVVVDRLLDSTFHGTPTYAELDAAIARLDAQSYSAREVALRLGCTVRTVQRHRAARRRTAA